MSYFIIFYLNSFHSFFFSFFNLYFILLVLFHSFQFQANKNYIFFALLASQSLHCCFVALFAVPEQHVSCSMLHSLFALFLCLLLNPLLPFF